jgi:hypothetical protein
MAPEIALANQYLLDIVFKSDFNTKHSGYTLQVQAFFDPQYSCHESHGKTASWPRPGT